MKMALPMPVPKRQNNDQSAAVPSGAKCHFSNAGRIGIIQHNHPIASMLFQQTFGIRADPAAMDVGGCERNTVLDNRRERTSYRPLPVKMTRNLLNRVRDWFRL